MKKNICFFFTLLIFFAGSPKQPQAQALQALGICLENYPYPYPVHYITLHQQGSLLKMAYMDVKPGRPNGHSILLLHGKNFNGAYWKNTIAALVENGYRVIVPDQIGFGKSSKPATFQYSFQQLAENTKDLLDSAGIGKLSVLGHSMGGMLATRFALMYPDLVEKFILEDPIGLEDWKRTVPYQSVDSTYRAELKRDYRSFKHYEQENYYHGTWKPEYDEWLNLLAGWTLSPDYSRIAWNSALTTDMIFTQPVCYEFDRIQAPCLLIIGQLDKTAIGKDRADAAARKSLGNYPVLGRITQQKIKGSKLIEIPGVGHIPHVEAFEKFIRPLLDFLKQPSPGHDY